MMMMKMIIIIIVVHLLSRPRLKSSSFVLFLFVYKLDLSSSFFFSTFLFLFILSFESNDDQIYHFRCIKIYSYIYYGFYLISSMNHYYYLPVVIRYPRETVNHTCCLFVVVIKPAAKTIKIDSN